MAHTVLFDDGIHKNILLDDVSGDGLAVQANQHVIIDGKSGMILDPGGHKVYSKVLSNTLALLSGGAKLETIFLSHQDPDIVAAVNGWLMSTDATAHVSALWIRFVAHFGLDRLVEKRLLPIHDAGTLLTLGGSRLPVLPAHFLHSPGNFQLYDPTAKILYSGDLGASIGTSYREVHDFNAHLEHMVGFHKRYMANGKVMKLWADMARALDLECIAPQHGALFKGKEMVNAFIDWASDFPCGTDLVDAYRVPSS